MTRSRRPLPVLLLAAFGTFTGLLILETVARVTEVREERREGRLDRDLSQLVSPGPGSSATLGQMIRKSENPRIAYELRPRLDVVFSGGRVTTSDAGHRGLDVVRPKPSHAFRIVGIGDSYMFGQGVSDEETYLARLAEPGNDFRPGRRLETVNLAVPGFNTTMEVEMLRERGAAFEPDLVLIEIVGNDLDLPNFLWSAVDPWTLRRSFLLEFVRSRFAGAANPNASGSGLSEAPHESGGAAQTYARDAARVPEAYRSLVGLDAFRTALGDLADFGRVHDVPVLALTHGVWFEDDMLTALKSNDIPVLVLRSALRQRARQLDAPDYGRSPLAISATDLHPSAAGHQAIAEELAAWLKERLPNS